MTSILLFTTNSSISHPILPPKKPPGRQEEKQAETEVMAAADAPPGFGRPRHWNLSKGSIIAVEEKG